MSEKLNVKEMIDENLIKLNLKSKSQLEVIQELANLLKEQDRITDIDEFIKNVLEREALSTTGFGNGIAIPHARTDVVKRATLVYAKLENPVDWKAFDGADVSVILLLAVPESDKNNTHLMMLSKIATNLMENEFIEKLHKIDDKEELLNILQEAIN